MKKRDYILIGIALLLIFYYFASPVNIFFDTVHYQSYIQIFEGKVAWANWDIVRGVVFPFILYLGNLLFGKTAQGALMLTFIFYIGMLFGVKLILDNCLEIKSKKTKNIVYIAVFGYLIIDPIIYGYYHALLTEFVAMTLSLVICFLSWKWLHLDFFENKKKYIIYSVIFVLTTIFAWHLKQPYVGVALFPVMIAAVISIFKKFNLKNVLSRISTVALCIVGLVLSMVVWNSFLDSKGVNLNTNRNVTSSLGNMLIGMNYELTSSLENTEYLSEKEIEKLKTTDDYIIINTYSTKGKLIDQDIVKKDKNGNISTLTAVKFLSSQIYRHPVSLMDNYFTTYLAIANVYPKVTDDAVTYSTLKKLDINYCHENCVIALRVSEDLPNTVFARGDNYYLVENYEQVNDSPNFLRLFFKLVSKITLNLYKVVILVLPIFSVVNIVSLSKKKNKDNYKILSMVTILSWYSLMHIMVHVVTGANIDRYASPAYITTLIALVLYIYFLCTKGKKIKQK